jgi:hypothetical protein
MAEIRIERKQSSAVPWIVGIIVMTLVILWGLKMVALHSRATAPHRATSAVDTYRDPTPPRPRQVAQATLDGAVAGTLELRAA